MKKSRKYNAIVLSGNWAIQRDFALIEGGRILANASLGAEFDESDEPEANLPRTLAISTGATRGQYVSVVPVFGAMTSEDQFCGPAGMRTIAARITEAQNDPQNIGTILHMNSPGGQVSAEPILREAIAAHKAVKPIVVLGELVASAALMAGAAANKIIMAYETSIVGSLGVMGTLYNDSERLKTMGIERHVIYSSLSEDKNAPVEEALKGEYDRIRAETLDPLAQHYIDRMKADRPGITNDAVFRGKEFLAKDALNIGLIDGIGNLEYAKSEVIALSNSSEYKKKGGANAQAITSNPNKMKLTSGFLPFVMAALALQEIQATAEGNYELPAESAEKLQNAFFSTFGKALVLKGIAVGAEGNFTASVEQLTLLEALFRTAHADHTAAQLAELQGYRDSAEPRQPIKPKGSAPKVDFIGSDKPWDVAARMYLAASKETEIGTRAQKRLEAQNYENMLSATLVVDQMNQELGAYHQMRNTNIIEFLWPSQNVDALFPSASTGQFDEMPQTALFTNEFLQARNAAWAEKGGFEFQADKTKLTAYQMSTRFTEGEMFAFMRSWLAELAGGDHPFHETFVNYLIRKIAAKVREEIQQNIFTGYYVAPSSGTAGPAKHAISGLLSVLLKKYNENRMLPTFNGKPEYTHYLADGSENPNHLFFKVRGVFDSIPQQQREGATWNAYISTTDKEAYEIFLKKVLLVNTNYADVAAALQPSNMNVIGLPNWPNGAIVIAQPGFIRQGYRERGNDNMIYTQREKRDTIAFLDGAHVIAPVFTGYKFANRAALLAGARSKQYVFTNLQFGALSPLDLAANATTADASVHYAFRTVENGSSTTFSSISNLVEGQTVYMIGGSSTNPTTIASSNTNFAGLSANLVLTAGKQAEFLVVGGKLTLVGLTQLGTTGVNSVLKLTENDTTPSLAGGFEFMVPSTNDNTHTDITNFTDASVGAEYTIHGATGTNQVVLKNNANLLLGADVTMTSGAKVTLRYTNMGTFVKIA